MYHTEIDLSDEVADKVQSFLTSSGKTFKQFVQQAIEHELQRQQNDELANFFMDLKPLESFAGVDATTYVDDLRGKSRIING
jgi:predicted DNA-binding protein